MARLGKFRVLVVLHDSASLERYEEALCNEFEVVTLTSGASAKQLLESQTFDVLVCDQEMPEGLEVLEYCHRLHPRTRRVVLSSLSESEPLLWSVSHGHSERYLCKPVSSGALRRCVAELMAEQESGRSGWLLCGASDLLSDIAQRMRQQGESVVTSATVPVDFEANTVLLLAPSDSEEIRNLCSNLARSHHDKSLLVAVDRENTNLATTALLEGAMDVIFLPIQIDELIRRASLRKNCRSWRNEAGRLRMDLARQGQEPSLIGSSPAMRTVFATIERVARTKGDVLIQGEVGTGKALVAKALHHTAGRSGEIECLKLAEMEASEMEAAIFDQTRKSETSLFIEGIENLELRLQDRLLRERLSDELAAERCHLIVGASTDLDAAVSRGELISGLRDHIRKLNISVPALRDRGEDIPTLAVHFVSEHSERLGRTGITLGRGAMAELCGYDWPENVSELRRVVEHAVELAGDNSEIASGMLRRSGHPIVEQVVEDIIGGGRGLDAAMAELEAAVIAEALEQHQGNRSAAARQLKLPRQTLQDRMKKHGLWSS